METNPRLKWGAWTMNVIDRFKGLTVSQIKQELRTQAPRAAILMGQIEGDFNISNIIRSANSFGIVDIFYFGRKKFDKRGCVGSHHYVNIKFLSLDEIKELKHKYVFVGLENNIDEAVPIQDFNWPPNSLICLGEEGNGIPKFLLDMLDFKVEIPSFGSVRSMNVASAGAIAMYSYINSVER